MGLFTHLRPDMQKRVEIWEQHKAGIKRLLEELNHDILKNRGYFYTGQWPVSSILKPAMYLKVSYDDFIGVGLTSVENKLMTFGLKHVGSAWNDFLIEKYVCSKPQDLITGLSSHMAWLLEEGLVSKLFDFDSYEAGEVMVDGVMTPVKGLLGQTLTQVDRELNCPARKVTFYSTFEGLHPGLHDTFTLQPPLSNEEREQLRRKNRGF